MAIKFRTKDHFDKYTDLTTDTNPIYNFLKDRGLENKFAYDCYGGGRVQLFTDADANNGVILEAQRLEKDYFCVHFFGLNQFCYADELAQLLEGEGIQVSRVSPETGEPSNVSALVTALEKA